MGSRYTFKPDPHSSHSIVLRWLGEGRGRPLLDVGAADGLLSRHLTARGWRVTGIESDHAAAKIGAEHCERMVVADLDREGPDVDGPFDVIVYADVLEHLADPLGVLRRLNRTLARDGRIVISVPNVAHLWIRLCLLAGRFDYVDRGILDRTHLRFFTLRSLRRLLKDAGLVPLQYTATPVPLSQVVPPRWQGPGFGVLHAMAAVTARALPRLLGYQLVVQCRRAPGTSA